MKSLPFAWCVLLLATTVDGRAQAPTPAPEPRPTLHDAWLFEVLDLDLNKAIAAYSKVAADPRPGNLDRWVAVARLAELKHLGVEVTSHVDLKDVPEPLRAPLASIATPLPIAELRQRVQGDPTEVLQRIGTDAGRLPTLHPLTPKAEEWRLAQIPWLREQVLRTSRNRAAATPNPDWLKNFAAEDIVRIELAGWQSRADALRALWFPNWRPPTLAGDPKVHLEKFRTNLEAWAEQSQQQRDLLHRLREAVTDKSATDAAAALALVARLPVYGERLLGLAAPASR